MKRVIAVSVFFFTAVFAFNYFVSNSIKVSASLDDGLISRIFFLSVFSSLFIGYIRPFKVKRLISGFALGLCSYLFVLACYSALYFINEYSYPEWTMHTTMLMDNLAAASLVFILGTAEYFLR